MSGATRRVVLFLALAATLVAAWMAPKPEADSGVVLAPASARQSPPRVERADENGAAVPMVRSSLGASLPTEVLSVLPRHEDSDFADGAFGSVSWGRQTEPARTVPKRAVPAASDVAQAAPEPVQAPPLPFQVLGRYEESGKRAIFLLYGEQSLVVHVGDAVGKDYKAEKLTDTALTLRYLPLDLLQELPLGKAQ